MAADPAKCKLVRMSDPGWSDITSTNALLGMVLKGLGYEQKVETLAVPVTYKSLGEGIIDVFLGNWMPAQKKFVEPLIARARCRCPQEPRRHLKFTLAVPDYVAEGGVRTVEDLAEVRGQVRQEDLRHRARRAGQSEHAGDDQGRRLRPERTGRWSNRASRRMLAQVDRAGRQKNWIVFVGWEPHPMNTKLKMTYLSGGEKTFGANYGASEVFTVARKGLTEECPNLARLLRQTTFTVAMENEVMAAIEAGKKPEEAASAWLKANPATVTPWLEGVTTFDGKDGAGAVKASLGL